MPAAQPKVQVEYFQDNNSVAIKNYPDLETAMKKCCIVLTEGPYNRVVISKIDVTQLFDGKPNMVT